MTTLAQRALDAIQNGDPRDLATIMQKLRIGTLLCPLKIVGTAITATATLTMSSLRNGTDGIVVTSLIGGNSFPANFTPPKVGLVRTLRVGASGTGASVGTYVVTDRPDGATIVPPGGASAAAGIAELSDDGDIIQLPNTITGFTLVYFPMPYIDLDTAWPPTS
jgi:hypothetical protein